MESVKPTKYKHGYQPIDLDVVKTPMIFRIAIMAVVVIFALIAIGGNVRTSINQAKSNTTPTQTPVTQPTEAATPAASSASTVNKPQTSTTNSSFSSKTCNVALRTSYTNEYNSQIQYENTRHDNQINLLTATGAPASAFAAENNTHAVTLNSILAQYQSNLRSINC